MSDIQLPAARVPDRPDVPRHVPPLDPAQLGRVRDGLKAL